MLVAPSSYPGYAQFVKKYQKKLLTKCGSASHPSLDPLNLICAAFQLAASPHGSPCC